MTGLTTFNLPAIINITSQNLQQVTAALGVSRTLIASDGEITNAWTQLPRLLEQIPRDQLNEQHVRMCIAVSSGLFDSAINYAWNTAVMALRERVRAFGLNVVTQIIRSQFDEEKLVEQKDAELLTLCFSLNLISEEAYFFLDQCRSVRNSFSTAHPPLGGVNSDEFIAFLSRCGRYALSVTQNPRGVDSSQLINAVKSGRHSTEQSNEWVERFHATHDQQRVILIPMLHGIYCDPASTEEARLNCLDICIGVSSTFSPAVTSELVNRHSDYIADGVVDRQTASTQFFQRLGILGLLGDAERHRMLSSACRRLFNVHLDMNNFYNEPPFAERLRELALQISRPPSARAEYVQTVVACAIGNPYGVSRAAVPDYQAMVRNFSPAEVEYMLSLASSSLRNIVSERLQRERDCQLRFAALVRLIDSQTVPTSARQVYDAWCLFLG